MKKFAFSCIALAASTTALAQASVTLFGVVDTDLSYLSADGIGHETGLSNGNNAASRLGFRGGEDLGGSLAASFWLEGGWVSIPTPAPPAVR